MLTQLIYLSQPFGFDRATLADLLLTARRNNKRDEITGALICRHDLYLQLIEGPQPAIAALYDRILADDRHRDVVRLWSGTIDERMFPAWEMLNDPPRSWLPHTAEVAAGAMTAAPAEDIRDLFRRLAREVGKPAASAMGGG